MKARRFGKSRTSGNRQPTKGCLGQEPCYNMGRAFDGYGCVYLQIFFLGSTRTARIFGVCIITGSGRFSVKALAMLHITFRLELHPSF